MTADDVLEVLAALDAGGVRYRVGGGWGTDALLGRQTRDHHDLDLAVEPADAARVEALLPAFHRVSADEWPRFLQLADGRGRRVDLELLPAERPDVSVTGRIGGRPVRTSTVLQPKQPVLLLYLDQNYLSGIAKRKPAFCELERVLRGAVSRGAVAVPESAAHRLESAPRPDLALLELLRGLSGGLELPDEPEAAIERRLARVIERDFPGRVLAAGDLVDLRALATALPRCRLVTCDAFMADVVRRAAFDVRFRAELYTGRRPDVEGLCARLAAL